MKALAALVVVQSAIIVSIFLSFPLFPQFLSADFEQHVRIATDVSRGALPSPLLLYGGVEYYLAFFIKTFSWLHPLIVERYAMGLLAVGCSPVFYFAAKRLSGSRTVGSTVSCVYVFSGFVWFGYVFDSGLYANFFGVIASLSLLAATVWFMEGHFMQWKVGVYAFVLAVALLSHYSTLLVFPAILAFCIWKLKDKGSFEQSAVVLAIFILAAIAGARFFDLKALLDTLVRFTGGSVGVAPPLTPLGKIIHVPVFQYVVAEIDPPDPFRSDTAALGIFLLLASFAYMTYRMPDSKKGLLWTWFLTCMAVAPFNIAAWRFAYAALVPLTIMAGWGLSPFLPHVKKFAKRVFLGKRYSVYGRNGLKAVGASFVVVFLVVLPVFANSWSSAAFSASISDSTAAYARSDYADYQALQYMKTIGGGCGTYHNQTCIFATVTDWRLGYSQLMGGPPVVMIQPNPLSTVDVTERAAADARATYFIATNIESNYTNRGNTLVVLPYCIHLQTITISVLNSTSGSSIELGVSALPRLNHTDGPLNVMVNGSSFGQFFMSDGRATVNIVGMPPGKETIRVRYFFEGSNEIALNMGTGDKPLNHALTPNACSPWGWYSDDYGPGAKLVYQNWNVKIWKIKQ